MQNHSNEYEYAGFWVRLAAYAIDMTIVAAGLLIVRIVFIGINAVLAGTVLEGGILFHYTLKDITLYLLQVVYFILFTYYTGTTLGKKVMNLCVIRVGEETKLDILTVIYRETVGRFLCGLVLCIGYILVGVDKEKRGLHDIICDTRVIYGKKVKVYPVYRGTVVKPDVVVPTVMNTSMNDVEDNFVPRMVDENETNQTINPQEEEYNIEGDS